MSHVNYVSSAFQTVSHTFFVMDTEGYLLFCVVFFGVELRNLKGVF